MDIGAWERRTAAVEGLYDLGYDLQEEDECYYDDAGEPISHAEYQELLFRRVLDKIRVARATGDPDVQLSPEELEAYQSRLHGSRAPAALPQTKTRASNSPVLDDAASVLSAHTSRPEHTSKSKSKKKTSLFSSKPKKEKPSSRKRAVSSVSSGSSQIPPGFVVPGPEGHPVYTPINPYHGNLARPPSRPSSGSASANNQVPHTSSHMTSPQAWQNDLPGAFPGMFAYPQQAYWPMTPPDQVWQNAPHPYTWDDADDRIQPEPAPPAKLVPFPVEPYQYQSFSPSSSSQPSPQLQYTRQPSAPVSEASYTSMPRRVPVPAQPTAPVADVRDYSDHGFQQPTYPDVVANYSSDVPEAPAVEVLSQPVPVPNTKASGSGKDGERRRKGGKTKKKS
ncbi:hypothetical protein CC86DRAFT_400721 [Ophiobolus disseminans]|uniref:Uncharacterized protein n=1 Tax=Ophiobolus disseminans TaxID=1469910 RepID=A0A6A7AF51_9PLEO|nr:hypothetical protein CC86DRAFT_400721 [Ophiobolus disseminans]